MPLDLLDLPIGVIEQLAKVRLDAPIVLDPVIWPGGARHELRDDSPNVL